MINRIRDIRKQKRLTLADVAERCDPPTTAQTIGRLETGMRNLSLVWMNRIGAALGVEPELQPDVFRDVRAVLDAHPRSAPIEVRWSDGNGGGTRLRSRSLKMAANGAALAELRALLGPARVKLVRVA